MHFRTLFCLPVVLAASWCSVSFAGSGEIGVAPSVDAKVWIERMRAASRERNFQGTVVFSAGEVMSSSRIGHYCTGDQSFERIETLDGRRQRVFRYNDVVHTFWPDSRSATIERRNAVVNQGSSLPELDLRMQEHYAVRMLGRERVAGREAQVILLSPHDEFRFAQRLWADVATGLMLRIDHIGPKGQVLESSAFSDIDIDVRPQRDSVLVPMKQLDGYRVVTVSPAPTTLESEGWAVKQLPPGFRMTRCVRRALDGPADGNGGEKLPEVIQAVFSDGMARVSVFIEPETAAPSRRPLLTHMGATHSLMLKHSQRWWFTVMGDVPADTLRSFAGSLERRR